MTAGLEEVYGKHWLSRMDEYRYPPKINFGLGAASKVGEIAKGIARNKNTIIVTDKILEKLGLIEEAKASLEEEGFNTKVYVVEVAEPTLEETRKVIAAVSEGEYGLVVGIGGGSCMDKAKIGACLSESPGDLEKYLAPNGKELPGTKPKILIPTTSGTGSEVSNTAVVILPHEDVGYMKTWITGNLVLADAAIIDPVLTLGLPPKMTAGSGLDALSHSAEGVLSIQANPVSDALGLKSVELATENLRTVYHHGDNIEARWNMSLAAMLGGLVISFGWVAGPATLGHVVSEGISARYGIPHGEACGVLLPYVYYFNLPDDYAKKKLAIIAKAMKVDITDSTTQKAARKAIEVTFDLLEDVDMPTNLKEYNIPEEDVPMISDYILKRAEEMYTMHKYNPRKATRENIREFFTLALEGREALGL